MKRGSVRRVVAPVLFVLILISSCFAVYFVLPSRQQRKLGKFLRRELQILSHMFRSAKLSVQNRIGRLSEKDTLELVQREKEPSLRRFFLIIRKSCSTFFSIAKRFLYIFMTVVFRAVTAGYSFVSGVVMSVAHLYAAVLVWALKFLARMWGILTFGYTFVTFRAAGLWEKWS
jgi:hypothetical protein